MNKSILVSSEKLKHNLLKKRLLQENININLSRLNTLIENTYKDNKNVLITRLPIGFNIPDNINEKEFSLEFYFNLVEILEEKGYVVKLRIEEKQTTIKISWKIQSDSDLDYMKKKLKDLSF